MKFHSPDSARQRCFRLLHPPGDDFPFAIHRVSASPLDGNLLRKRRLEGPIPIVLGTIRESPYLRVEYSHAVQEFLELDLGKDAPPDETTILRCRHLIEEKELGPKILVLVNQHLEAHGVRIGRGTIVDATVIHAPTSTKNDSKSRDPEMGSTKKGNQ